MVIRQVEPSEVAPEGTVTRTEPAAGSQLAEGSQVFVYVSSGPAVLAMPDLIGLNPTTALIQLDTLGVTAQVVPVAPLPGEASNIIVSQDPAAGTAITPGSLISLFVTGESAPGGEGGVPAGGDGQGNPEQLLRSRELQPVGTARASRPVTG